MDEDARSFREKVTPRHAAFHYGGIAVGMVCFAMAVVLGAVPLFIVSGIAFLASGMKALGKVDTEVTYRLGPTTTQIEQMGPTSRRAHSRRVGWQLIGTGVFVLAVALVASFQRYASVDARLERVIYHSFPFGSPDWAYRRWPE